MAASRCGCRCSWWPASSSAVRARVLVAWIGGALFLALLGLGLLLKPARPPIWAAAAAALGVAAAQFATFSAPPLAELPTRATIVAGVIGAVEDLPQGRRVTIERPLLDGGQALPRSLRLRLRANDTTDLAAGDSIRLRALLNPPSPPAYPGGWDTQRDAFFGGQAGFGFALGPAEHGVTEHGTAEAPGGIGHIVQTLRETIAHRIGVTYCPGPAPRSPPHC